MRQVDRHRAAAPPPLCCCCRRCCCCGCCGCCAAGTNKTRHQDSGTCSRYVHAAPKHRFRCALISRRLGGRASGRRPRSPLLLVSPALAASAPGGASPVARDAASRDRLPQSPAQLWVDCQHGSDAAAGVSPEAAVRTIQRALALRRGEATPAMFGTGTVIINVVGGRRCEISAATLTLRQADSNTILRGDDRIGPR